MSFLRVLHIDDDTNIRDVVALSLGLDLTMEVRGCASGKDGLAAAKEFGPHIILLDVMMPVMDGPTTLGHFLENPQTSDIPVVFMTARAQKHELEHFRSLGAAGAIAKPFDPMTLAASVRGHLRTAKVAAASYDFRERLRTDAAALTSFHKELGESVDQSIVPDGLLSCVHKLAGAAGVFDFQSVSRTASALEDAIIESAAGRGNPGKVAANLDALLECLERE